MVMTESEQRPPAEEMLRLGEVARMVKRWMTRRQLDTMLKHGTLRGIRPGPGQWWVVPRSAAEELVERCEKQEAGTPPDPDPDPS